MKLIIKTQDTNLRLYLPTALAINRLSTNLVIRILNTKCPSIQINKQDMTKLLTTIKNLKKQHKNRCIELVDITTIDGERIYVSI